jgi:iron complex transport system substrate-binding protein
MPLRSRVATLAVVVSVAIAALVFAADPAYAAAFMDAAGRRVILPDRISRILPAERNAEVLIFALAPDRLAALENIPGRAAGLPRGTRAPLLRWRPRSTPDSMAATARQVGADVIVDAGPVSPAGAAFADEVQRLSGVPYVLVDDSFARMPIMLRSMGAILGVSDRADDLALFADHAIDVLHGHLLIQPAHSRRRVYYGLGPDGLTTPLPGSPAAATLEEAGTINVAAGLGRGTEVRITPDQLRAWDPDIIIAGRRSFYTSLQRDRTWRGLSAVRNKHVYLEPTDPFGWIEDPSGVNRVIGLYWLAALLYPEAAEDEIRSAAWRSITCDFYVKFYRIRLTNARLDALLQAAGAPRVANPKPTAAELLSGLGTAPSTVPPVGTPGAPGSVLTPSVPTASGQANSDACALPTGPSPNPLPGITLMPTPPLDNPPSAAPGVPVPGQRGRPVPGLPNPANPTGLQPQ